jgi:hypothetical protein
MPKFGPRFRSPKGNAPLTPNPALFTRRSTPNTATFELVRDRLRTAGISQFNAENGTLNLASTSSQMTPCEVRRNFPHAW